MTGQTSDEAVEELPADDAVVCEAPPAAVPPPPRRRRKLRPAALIILPLIPLLVLGVVWIFGDAVLAGRIHQAITDVQLDPGGTVIETSILGGNVSLVDVDLIATYEDETRSVYRSPRTLVDVAVLDSLVAGAAIIEELTIRDAVIDLRRFSDGTVPGPVTEEEPEMDAPTEQPPRDLVELYTRLRKWYDRTRDRMPERGGDETVADAQPVRPAEGWDRAVRYFPQPTAEEAGSFPRTVIRKLDIGGDRIVLPDSGLDHPSPLDLSGFSLTGTQVTTRLEPGETMDLGGSYLTAGAGAGSFSYRAQATAGGLRWTWDDVPIAILTDPSVSGDRLASYQPSGTGRMQVDLEWVGEALSGNIMIDLEDLRLKPSPQAGSVGQELARALEELRKLHAQLSPESPFLIRWPLIIGGSTSQPRITDLGTASLLTAIKDTGRRLQQAATAKAKAAVAETTGAALEAGKGLIEDVKSGKDVEASAQERLKNLEGQGGALKGLLPSKK